MLMRDGLNMSSQYLAEDISYKLSDTTYFFIILITFVFALFIISRTFCAERNDVEIWALYPISYLFCLSLCITCICECTCDCVLLDQESTDSPVFTTLADGGRHITYILATDPSKVETWLKIQTADEALYMTGLTLPKVAILILYLRIFVERKIRLITKIVLVVVILHWLTSGIIVMFTVCQPFSFKWDKSINGHCSDLLAAYRYISIPNILTDLAILILPISTLYRLHMSWIRKLGVFLTFLAGGLYV